MHAAVYPANDALRIGDCGTGQLGSVLKLRRAPILREARGFILMPTCFERGVGEELQKIIVAKTHRSIGSLRGIPKADGADAERRTKRLRFALGTNYNKAHRGMIRAVFFFELAQLRERFSEERSTDVS